MQARKEWGNIFIVLNEKEFQPRLLYPTRLFFIWEEKIKPFFKQNLKKLTNSRPALQKVLKGGPAVSVMAMSLNSHVVDRGLSPRPSGLNSHWAHVRVCPRSREENGEGIAAWPSPLGGDFSLSVSLSVCLRGERMCPIAKTSPKKKKNVLKGMLYQEN